ncbi:GGDEF domain-containing protein [Halalkalibacter alkaliphilus]|uniref:GGDEF domain-containing protein n=1 Tax=Halalkalibacter alkaliphilus TaxID=2917993 RepID=A0A9X2A499_9BACI|nr:GGDEF domain-containing protein [Halalkalibacter alkaliphilus]MCL7746657.1 GGDEF domain-containing protein [Halalkalibacter alkaliphilus]
MNIQKRIIIIFIVLTTLLPIILEVYFVNTNDYPVIWSLLILPAMGTIIAFPSWKTTIFTTLIFSIIKYTVEILERGLYQTDLSSLILGSLIKWVILFTIAFYVIQNTKRLKAIQELTLIDQLTEVYNRRYFDLYMEKAIPLSERTGTPFHLIILDIDFFKKVNDSYGHTFGDEVLKILAKTIQNNLRGSDGLVRMGGEEFAILIPETTTEECHLIADRIRQAVETTDFIYKGKKISVTISLGIAKYTGETIHELYDKADQALYQSKKNGRNKITLSHH